MVSVQVFVEGGGNEATVKARCRKGFSDYCKRVTLPHRNPAIVACGGRDEAFKRFCIAIKNCRQHETVVLLVDAEDAVCAGSCLEHLSKRDPSWRFPELQGHRIFLMVQAMEAWFLADRETLHAFYGKGFLIDSLPGSATSIESIPKADLEPKLSHAAKPTIKGEYHKTKHGFALLALIDPNKVGAASPHAAHFHSFLRSL